MGTPAVAWTQPVTPPFQQLSAGARFTCGLSADGRAFCWGADVFGQLGIGGAEGQCDRSIYATGPCARTPRAVLGEHRFVAITAGDDHACAIDDAGALHCWGSNQSHQLGLQNVSDRCARTTSRGDAAIPIACSRQPVRVPLERTIAAVTAGDAFTCAADTAGQVWCWGFNGRSAAITPVELDANVVGIAAGGRDVCAVTVEGRIRCWNWPGVINEGSQAPVAEAGWHSLTVGAGHACALDAGNRAHCWGNDADGALGIGPGAHDKHDERPATPVSGDRPFENVTTGTIRTCGIGNEGALYCWGRVGEAAADSRCLDSNGVAGTNDCTTHPLHVQRSMRFRSVAIGWSHQCGLTIAGETVCWGDNESGQLGDGSLRESLQAVSVRTTGLSPSQANWIDNRERLGWLMWHGGGAALIAAALALAGRGRTALPSLRTVLMLWTAAVAVSTLLVAVAPLGDRFGGRGLVRSLAWQPVLVIGGLTLYLLALRFLEWWRAGSAAPDVWRPVRSGWTGAASIAAVLVGWAVFGAASAMVAASEPRGELGFAYAMLTLLAGGAVAVALATLGLVLGVIAFRNTRSKAALAGLVLSALTCAVALVAAAVLFWPREQ